MTRRTLHEASVDTLGEQIVSGVYHAGQVLRTEDLQTERDLSRTVLRETLKVLESLGLVRMRRQVGITVQGRAEWSVFDPRIIGWRMASDDRADQLSSLTDLRYVIEPIAARNAALSATPEQREEIAALAALMLESGIPRDTELHLERDIAFHSLLLRSSGNEMFAALTPAIAAVLTGRTVHHLIPPDPTQEALDLHVEVAQAVLEGNPEHAERAMRLVLTEVKDYLPHAEHDSDLPSPPPGTPDEQDHP